MAFCSNGELEIHYLDSGSGTPLVFLHGLGSSSDDWRSQCEFFARHYRVLAIDLRGHGCSATPAGLFSVEDYASDVVAVMDHLGIAGAHVIGLSMGGMAAFQLACTHEQRLLSLTIVNSAPAVEYRSLAQKLRVWQRLLIIRLLGMRMLGQMVANRLFPKAEQAGYRQQFIAQLAQFPQDTYLRALRSFLGWDVTAQLSHIQVPVFVVTGDRDYTPVAAKAAYADIIPHSELYVIPDSGHATPIDQSEAFNVGLSRFLSQVPLKHYAQDK